MSYPDLVRLYFDRSSALQWYWTLYVLIIGGLLAFSSLRQRPAVVTTLLVTILYCCFAYKNLGAIYDVTMQRSAVVQAIKEEPGNSTTPTQQPTLINPTLNAPDYPGVRNFHVMCDVLTVAAIWAMEFRRRRLLRTDLAAKAALTP